MPSIAYKFAHKRVLVIEEVLEDWEIDHEEANIACAVEELVKEAISTLRDVERLVTFFKPSIRPDARPEVIVRAHQVGSLLGKGIDLIPKIKELAEDSRRNGYTIDGLSELVKLETELLAVKSSFFQKWLLPDSQRIKTAKAQIAAGNYKVL